MRNTCCSGHPVWLAVAVLAVLAPCSVHSQSSTATGLSPDANPAISTNALFLGSFDSKSSADSGEDEPTTGFLVQEVELQLSSFVDPYWKADIILALPEGEGIEVEEGFVRSLSLPGDLQLQVGKFYAALGRHNLLHTHAFDFLDAPLVNEHLLGDEGLNEAGLSLSWLAPLPWFVEVTGQVLDGGNELFASDRGEDLLYLSHLKSFHEVGDATTIEWGASAASGANARKGTSSLLGVDLTLKWRPVGAGTQRAFIWQTEYLRAKDDTPGAVDEGGLYSQMQMQIKRRWWLQARADLLDLPGAADSRTWRGSLLVAVAPSEFSALRLQYSRLHEEADDVHQLIMQLNVTVGSHPAHRY